MQQMSDNTTKRPDPLQVAVTAIGDYERSISGEPGQQELFQRAQLRILFALTAEVRAVRVLMATGAQDENDS
jgi:hypothetical protein